MGVPILMYGSLAKVPPLDLLLNFQASENLDSCKLDMCITINNLVFCSSFNFPYLHFVLIGFPKCQQLLHLLYTSICCIFKLNLAGQSP